jgi:hypothetical protein
VTKKIPKPKYTQDQLDIRLGQLFRRLRNNSEADPNKLLPPPPPEKIPQSPTTTPLAPEKIPLSPTTPPLAQSENTHT